MVIGVGGAVLAGLSANRASTTQVGWAGNLCGVGILGAPPADIHSVSILVVSFHTQFLSKGFILDGFPCTVDQAIRLDRLLPTGERQSS